MPKKNANPTVAYTVRLTTDDKKWLDDMSLRTKVPVPTLLTWAIAALRQYAEAHGGIIPTPVDIRTLWAIAQTLDPRPSALPPANSDTDPARKPKAG